MEFEPGAYDAAVWDVAGVLLHAPRRPAAAGDTRTWAFALRGQVFDALHRRYEVCLALPEAEVRRRVERVLLAHAEPPAGPLWDRQVWAWTTACTIADELQRHVALFRAGKEGGPGRERVPWRG